MSSEKQITPCLHKGLFSYMAENEGFEPSIQVLPVCTLSRGVPSAARPILLKKSVHINHILPRRQAVY